MHTSWMKLFIISTLAIVLVGCASAVTQQPKVAIPPPQPITKATITQPPEYKLANFNSIYADGNLRIDILPPTQGNAMSAPPNTEHNKLNATVKNNTLYLSAKTQPKQHIPVKIWANYLSGIHISGNTFVNANDLRSSGLKVSLAGNASLRIRGKVNLLQLLNQSNGFVDIRWVDSKKLVVQTMNAGKIHLAGTADVLTAKVFGKSLFDAKYLRAKQALIQTGNYARADVLATGLLSAFASDHSNIYYYKTPAHLTRDSRLAGNVLQANYWR